MWIRRKEFEALVTRVKALENRPPYTPSLWYEDWPGRSEYEQESRALRVPSGINHMPCYSPPSIQLTECVRLILNHLGLRLVKTESKPSESLLVPVEKK